MGNQGSLPRLEAVIPVMQVFPSLGVTLASAELWSDRIVLRYAINPAEGEHAFGEVPSRQILLRGGRPELKMSLIDDVGTSYVLSGQSYSGGDSFMLGAATFHHRPGPSVGGITVSVTNWAGLADACRLDLSP
jgi:hypothetical protein